MKMNDLILGSVDDHIIEPPNMFEQHLSKEHLGMAPQFIVDPNGNGAWHFEGNKVSNIGLNAVVGRPREEYGCEPTSFDHMRPATYDVHKRIDDMNVNGLCGSLNFGTFVGFDGAFFLQTKDKTNALRCLQAYNDWHIDEWCAAYPGRFIPMAIIPLWDIAAAVEEVKRVKKKGCNAIAFSDNPAAKALPSIHNAYWEPLWRICNELKVVINCHIGTGFQPPHPSMESPINAWITNMPMSIASAAADWIHLAALNRYPDLKIALSEGGIGWIPYFLERADFTAQHHIWTRMDFGSKKPSDVFREHFICCFIDDAFGIKNYQDIGEDIICYETDYPHSDCAWPKAPEILWPSIENLPERIINKVTHENMMREYDWDPISVLGRDNCTVGGLRAQAAHVDTTPVSYGGGDPTLVGTGPITSGEVVKLFVDNLAGESTE